ncbi:low density lipoprotein receptor adapter protein 1 [Sarotherodon galilaeus]
MGNAQSYIVASLSVCSVYLVYVHVYCAHKLLKTNELHSDKLPSNAYVYMKYLSRRVTRRAGCLYGTEKQEAVYTVVSCRMLCCGGSGWDYPDSEYRDIPLCFPEFLCGRLLLMLLTHENFRLSPAGLVHVRQSLKTFQPIDELKKGPFTLRVQVLGYQPTDLGVEVDICLSATSRFRCVVWESVLTLLSENKLHKAIRCSPKNENESEKDEPAPDTLKQVELKVPWTADLKCRWSFPCQVLSLPARLFRFTPHIAPSLWMFSVCLAEIEKHKGVKVITAPVTVTAQFKEPLVVPGKVTVGFWEAPGNKHQSQSFCFQMQQHGGGKAHLVGRISRC